MSATEVKQDSTDTLEVPKTEETIPEYRVRLRRELLKEYEDRFKIWKTTDYVELEKRNQEIINEGLEKVYAKIKEDQKPPTEEDIKKLLAQDYIEFPVQLTIPSDDDAAPRVEAFTLRELPKSQEIKFYKIFKDRLLKNAQQLAAFEQQSIDMPFEDRLKAILLTVDEGLDVLGELVVICLDPASKKKYLDKKWIDDNVSSNRQWSIVEAQIMINRVRDFFSRVSQSGQQTQTALTGVNFRQLLQFAP